MDSRFKEKIGLFLNGIGRLKYPPAPFIVGVPRSGTTLLCFMLNSHSRLAIAPETTFVPALLKVKSRGDALLKDFYGTVITSENWSDFHLDENEFLEDLRSVKPFNISDGLRRFYKMYARRFNKDRWGDKRPPYLHYMYKIERSLPEARFIHLIRDGRDVALSASKVWWEDNVRMGEMAQRWANQIRSARRQSDDLKHYLEVRYEDLIRNTTATLKKICAFIDLPYEAGMERYFEHSGSRLAEISDRRTKDGRVIKKEQVIELHKLTRLPPEPSRIGRWKAEMNKNDLTIFLSIAGDLLHELGYET